MATSGATVEDLRSSKPTSLTVWVVRAVVALLVLAVIDVLVVLGYPWLVYYGVIG